MLTLSVVICAYTLDRWDDVQAAVASLSTQSSPVEQVVVVADHNTELLRRCREAFPDATVVPNGGPVGLSAGRNTGAAVSTGEVVAFLDDDAWADQMWAERLLAAYVDASVVGVGGQVVPEWRAPRPAWLPEEFLWVLGCSYRGQPRGRTEVRNAIGANMSFRRAVFERAGGFDLAVGRVGKDGAGCEETEFSLRAAAAWPGGRVMLEPSAVVHHVVTAQRVTRAYFRQRCRAEGHSKAVVSMLAGARQGLSSERTYTTQTLPSAVVRGLRDAVMGDLSGGQRALAVCEGFVLTATSYARGRFAQAAAGPR